MSSSISKHSKSAYGSAKNWLGKTTKNAGDNFNKAKNSASKNWGTLVRQLPLNPNQLSTMRKVG